MARKLRIRPNPVGSLAGGIVGLVFVVLGINVAIPAFGVFGVFWTALAAAIAVGNFYSAFSKRGLGAEIVEVDDERDADGDDGGRPGSQSTEARLRRLDRLRAKGVVTAEEHERRRAEILREI